MIRTTRLLLRPWEPRDLPQFAEQNADPIVMRFLGGPLAPAESDAYAARAMRHLADHGFGKWAVQAPGIAPFIGAVGLTHVRFAAPFTPAVEVAWRLHRAYWGQGYATEAARAAIDGFERIGLTDIVAMTAVGNLASRRVMEQLNMRYALAFSHPLRPEGDALRPHVLYRIGREPAGSRPAI